MGNVPAVLSRYSVRWLALFFWSEHACAGGWDSSCTGCCWDSSDVLLFKKSRTSFALKSRTGTWCSAGAEACAACAEPAALPLPPQALPEAADTGCGRPPSLVGVFVAELLRSWFGRFPCPGRRQLFTR
jgi:hypothetical protein